MCHKGPVSLAPDFPHNLPASVVEVATLDHTPKHVLSRVVVIRQEAQHAMTSGTGRLAGWTFDFKHVEKWTNPLTVRDTSNQAHGRSPLQAEPTGASALCVPC